MFYILQDGSVVEYIIGAQDSENNVVRLLVDGVETVAPMFWDDGDIGFTVKDEDVLFHWMKYKKDMVRK